MADAWPRLGFMKCGDRYARDDSSIGMPSAFLFGTGTGWPPLRLVASRRSGQGKSTERFLRRPEPIQKTRSAICMRSRLRFSDSRRRFPRRRLVLARSNVDRGCPCSLHSVSRCAAMWPLQRLCLPRAASPERQQITVSICAMSHGPTAAAKSQIGSAGISAASARRQLNRRLLRASSRIALFRNSELLQSPAYDRGPEPPGTIFARRSLRQSTENSRGKPTVFSTGIS